MKRLGYLIWLSLCLTAHPALAEGRVDRLHIELRGCKGGSPIPSTLEVQLPFGPRRASRGPDGGWILVLEPPDSAVDPTETPIRPLLEEYDFHATERTGTLHPEESQGEYVFECERLVVVEVRSKKDPALTVSYQIDESQRALLTTNGKIPEKLRLGNQVRIYVPIEGCEDLEEVFFVDELEIENRNVSLLDYADKCRDRRDGGGEGSHELGKSPSTSARASFERLQTREELPGRHETLIVKMKKPGGEP